MSSGLEIQDSSIAPRWKGKRLWINLSSLGIQSMHLSGAMKKGSTTTAADDEEEEEDIEQGPSEGDDHDDDDADEEPDDQLQHKRYKSLWLQHIALLDDMTTEHPGIKVRNIPGLAGVDYLSPGALMSYVSYVFGPVIDALTAVGYVEGENLDAAPYDWRLAPSDIEARDAYCTKTMQQIETMYKKNQNMPVVLVCHSLGCKMGHYFLNFCQQNRGQTWIDRHIHTYMPVGGPHLGAPKAVRSAISGTKMGLDAFLSDEEAMIFGRSLGSGPWMFPKELPLGATPTTLVRKQGTLAVRIMGHLDVRPLLRGRSKSELPKKIKVMIMFGKKKSLASSFVPLDRQSGMVSFPNETFIFATKAHEPVDHHNHGRLLVFMCEPGISVARRSRQTRRRNNNRRKQHSCCLSFLKCITCFCIWGPFLRLCWCLTRQVAEGAIITADAVARASGGSNILGTTKEKGSNNHHESNYVRIVPGTQQLTLNMFHRSDPAKRTTVSIQTTWEAWTEKLPPTMNCSSVSALPSSTAGVVGTDVTATNKWGDEYKSMSGIELFQREQFDRAATILHDTYDTDPRGPRTLSSVDAPPISRVKAVYGINLPTEVGAVYKKHTGHVDTSSKLKNYHRLDKSAKAQTSVAGYTLSGGILCETKDVTYQVEGQTRRVSGDGTVPYWSLQHVRSWKDQCAMVTTDEIDRAEHREILADPRFHQILIEYVTKKRKGGKTPDV